jgi:hypothetical protein
MGAQPNRTLVNPVALAHDAAEASPVEQDLWQPAALLVDRRTGRLMVQTDGFLRPAHDHRTFTKSGGNITSIVYRLGGASGVIVGTETLTYDGDGDPVTQGIALS